MRHIELPNGVRHFLRCGSAVVTWNFVVNLCFARNWLFWEILT